MSLADLLLCDLLLFWSSLCLEHCPMLRRVLQCIHAEQVGCVSTLFVQFRSRFRSPLLFLFENPPLLLVASAASPHGQCDGTPQVKFLTGSFFFGGSSTRGKLPKWPRIPGRTTATRGSDGGTAAQLESNNQLYKRWGTLVPYPALAFTGTTFPAFALITATIQARANANWC
ncbi:hypothetical protein GGR54DRAFT_84367 [Hypoxylon sp. NC1633]|nr:hypothetical protein GGR54DRAFT_84367 [Hypoxylon sp. NC1633]